MQTKQSQQVFPMVVFNFKLGFLGATPVSTQLSVQAKIGQKLSSNTLSQKDFYSLLTDLCGLGNKLKGQAVFKFTPAFTSHRALCVSSACMCRCCQSGLCGWLESIQSLLCMCTGYVWISSQPYGCIISQNPC